MCGVRVELEVRVLTPYVTTYVTTVRAILTAGDPLSPAMGLQPDPTRGAPRLLVLVVSVVGVASTVSTVQCCNGSK